MITIRKNMLLILSSAIMAVSCSGRHDAPDTGTHCGRGHG